MVLCYIKNGLDLTKLVLCAALNAVRKPRLTDEGREVNKTDNFGTNTRMMMHYSWLQHQKGGGECVPGAHGKQDTVGVREDDWGGGGGGAGAERREGGFVGEVEDRWHSPMVQTCWRSVLRIERYIYIFCVLPHLESTPLARVEHQETFEEVLTVRGHVERDAILPSEHALPQLLQRRGRQPGNLGKTLKHAMGRITVPLMKSSYAC